MTNRYRGAMKAGIMRQLNALADDDLELLESWNLGSVAWLLRQYDAGNLIRGCDCDTRVLIACEDRDALIDDMWFELWSIKVGLFTPQMRSEAIGEIWERMRALGIGDAE